MSDAAMIMGRSLVRWLAVAAIAARVATAVVIDPTKLRQEVHWSGASSVVAIDFAKDGSVFLTEKDGRIRLYPSIEADENDFVYVFDQEYEKTYTWWDRGMLGVAVDQNYPDAPFLWVFYSVNRLPGLDGPDFNLFDKTTCPADRHSYCGTAAHLVRVRVDVPRRKGTIEQVLVSDWCSASGSHHIGDLVWAPDGGLYLTAGDGASFDFGDVGVPTDRCYNHDDPRLQGSFRSQHMEYLQGKLLYFSKESLMADRVLSLKNNDFKILAKGLRNPYRFTVDPYTGDLYVGDVGSDYWEEINRVPNPLDPANAGKMPNFGWPCYEGNYPYVVFAPNNYPICLALAEDPLYHPPFFSYTRQAAMPSDDPDLTHCDAVNVSPTGFMFYTGDFLDEQFRKKLFWLDGSKRCAFYFDNDGNGRPDPTKLHTVLWTPEVMNQQTGKMAKPGQWVDIKMAPDGVVYIVDFFDSNVHRLLAQGVVTDPYAYIDTAKSRSLDVPFTTILDGSRSTTLNPGATIATFHWDFGNGKIMSGDRSGFEKVEVTFDYGVHTVKLTVTDTVGRSKTTTATVSSGVFFDYNVDFHPRSHEWDLSDTIAWQASIVTENGEPVAADKLNWRVVVDHCVESICGDRVDCHVHPVDIDTRSRTGALGQFRPFSHELPSFWEVSVTAEHPRFPGFFGTHAFQTSSRYIQIVLETQPMGLPLNVCPKTPCYKSIMAGTITEMFALGVVTDGTDLYRFEHWDVPGAPNDTRYRFQPTGDTVLTAIYAPTSFAARDVPSLPVPTGLGPLPGYGQIGLSWKSAGAPPAWFVVYLNDAGKPAQQYVVLGTTTTTTITVAPVAHEYTMQVASADADLRLGALSAPIPVASLAKPPAGFKGLCVPCFDDDLLIDDFESAQRFSNGVTLLNTVVGTDGTMAVQRRDTYQGSSMLAVAPDAGRASPILYFILGTASACFNFNPLSLPYTALEFDVVLPAPDARFEVRLMGNRVHCKRSQDTLALYALQDYVDVGQGGRGRVQHVRIPITMRDLNAAVESITLSAFEPADAGALFRFDNVRLTRACAEIATTPRLAFAACALMVDDYDDPVRFAIGHNLVPGPFDDDVVRGEFSGLGLADMARTDDGRLSLVPERGARVWEDLAPPGTCFDLVAHAIEYVAFDLWGDLGTSFNVRLALKRDDCSVRDDTNGSIFLAAVNDWGGFASRHAADRGRVVIPITAFGTSNVRRVHGLEFLHFAPAGRRVHIDNVALLQRCAVPIKTTRPTWCTLVVDDFRSAKRWAQRVNRLGGVNRVPAAATSDGDGVLGLPAAPAPDDVVEFELFDAGRKLCVDLSLYDQLVVSLAGTGSISIDFRVALTSRPKDCGGDPAAADLTSAPVQASRWVVAAGGGEARIAIPMGEFAGVPASNVHSVVISAMRGAPFRIGAVAFERADCVQFLPDTSVSLECARVDIDDFAEKSTFASTNKLGLLHGSDGTMQSVTRTPTGRMRLVPKGADSYWYTIVGDCVDYSKYTYLHMTVDGAGPGFDMDIYLQRSGACVGDRSPRANVRIGALSDFVTPDGTRKHVWVPLNRVGAADLKAAAAFSVSNLNGPVVIGNIYAAAGGCVPYYINWPQKSSPAMSLLAWLAIGGSILIVLVVGALLCRRRRRLHELKDTDEASFSAGSPLAAKSGDKVRTPAGGSRLSSKALPKLDLALAEPNSIDQASPLPAWLKSPPAKTPGKNL